MVGLWAPSLLLGSPEVAYFFCEGVYVRVCVCVCVCVFLEKYILYWKI